MPAIVHALFYIAYAIVSFAVGLALSRLGGADDAGATLGGLALFTSFAITHAGLAVAAGASSVRAMEKRLEKKIFGEIEKIKIAQREFAHDIDALGDQVARIDHAVELNANRRIEAQPAPVGMETKLIETLVDKLGRALDTKFDEVRRIAGGAPAAAAPRGPIDIVREALAENRVELHLQPIVSLPQRRTAFYEGFTRLKDATGAIVMPNEFMPVADAAGLTSTIDNMLLFRCVQIVRRLAKQDRRIGIFCNISPRSLSDEAFFPQFLDFMLENRDLAGSLIFELPQDAFERRGAIEARAMARLADLGFRFSIDKVSRLSVDLLDLERAGVRYVKVDGPSDDRTIDRRQYSPTLEYRARGRPARRRRDLPPPRHRSDRRAHRGRRNRRRNPRPRRALRPRSPVRRPARDQGQPDGRDSAAGGFLHGAFARGDVA